MIPIINQLILLLSLKLCGALELKLELGGGSLINSEGVASAVSHKAHEHIPTSNVHDKQNESESGNENNNPGLLRHLRAHTTSSSDDNGGNNIFDTVLLEHEHGDVIINGSSCRPVGQCQLCPGGKRSGKNGCGTTGKRQAFACLSGNNNANENAEEISSNRRRLEVASDSDDDDLYLDGNENLVIEAGKDRRIVYQSCSRTGADEERVMYRFQFFCVIIAFFSLRSVRREKMTTESLFDQRKRRASVARQQQQQQQLQKQQEMAPLFTRNGDDGMSLDGTEGSDSGSAHMNMMEDGDLDTSRKEKS